MEDTCYPPKKDGELKQEDLEKEEGELKKEVKTDPPDSQAVKAERLTTGPLAAIAEE
jgi:hypothetical protein